MVASDRLAPKDPDDELDYAIDYSRQFVRDGGDSIVSSAWDVPAPLSQPRAASFSASRAVVWVGGGEPGVEYRLTNTVETAFGRTYERSILVTVRER